MRGARGLPESTSKTVQRHAFRFGWGFRLHRADEIRAVFAQRRQSAIRTPLFTAYRRPNHFGHPRLGLAISRKAARRAVDRNRVKRKVRETFRQHLPTLPPMDFVVTCTRHKPEQASLSQTPPGEITRQLRSIWRKVSSVG